MTKVALSGAGGQVGSVLRPRLLERGVKLRSGGGMNPLTPLSEAEEVTQGDLRAPAVVDRLLQGVDVLIHLAGTSVERPLPEIIENNLRALHEVYEGARRHGVKRIVFASSNHAFGMYSVTDKLSIDAPFRPDGFYGLSKAWGEDMTRMYWDKHGIEGISIRIGSTLERPTEFRHLSTWFGYARMRPFSARLPLLYRSMTAATSSSRVAMLTRLITAPPTPSRPGAFQMRQQLNIREHFWRGNTTRRLPTICRAQSCER